MKMDNLVVSIKIINNNFVIATAVVAFITEEFGSIVVKDFHITKSEFGTPWVQPPKIQFYGRFYDRVFLEDKNAWEKVKEQILQAYEKAKMEYIAKNPGKTICEELEGIQIEDQDFGKTDQSST